MIFTSPVRLSMMLFGFRSAWQTLPAVHVDQAGGDLLEDLHQLRQGDGRAACPASCR